MSNLLLGVRTSLYDFKRIKLENVDFDSKVDCFKVEVSKKANIPKDSLELVYCGNILSNDATLRGSGIKPGVMVHVLKKKAKEVPHPSQPKSSEADIHALIMAFKSITLHPLCRTHLQILSRPDILDNIILITPGLSQDPVAISMIQDPELLLRMGDIETVRRIVELHPALAAAANHIANTIHEEEAIFGIDLASYPPELRQNAERFSDQDDMESSQSSDSVQQRVSRQQSFSAITPAQLAAALASASQGASSGVPGPSGITAVGGSSGSGETSNAITPEMVNEAMQRAMAAAVIAPSSGTETNAEGTSQRGNDFSEQMRQMRELGLTDDVVNLQALQLAGGNVHAAVDLVFSGAISSEHH